MHDVPFLGRKMSAFTVDISKHLEDTIKFIKIGPDADDVLRVDDDKNTVLRIQAMLSEDSSTEGINKVLELALGKEGFEKVNNMKMSYSAFECLFIGVMAAMSNLTYEQAEKRFRNQI